VKEKQKGVDVMMIDQNSKKEIGHIYLDKNRDFFRKLPERTQLKGILNF
jgi:hypothetical protein